MNTIPTDPNGFSFRFSFFREKRGETRTSGKVFVTTVASQAGMKRKDSGSGMAKRVRDGTWT